MASPIPISFTYTHCDADKYNNIPIMPLLDRYASHSCWRNSIKRAWHARLVNDQRAFWLRRGLPYQTWWMDDCNYPPSQVHPHPSLWHVSSRSHLAFRVCHSLILLGRLQDRANTKESRWRPLRIVRSLRTLLTVHQS